MPSVRVLLTWEGREGQICLVDSFSDPKSAMYGRRRVWGKGVTQS